MTDAVKAQQNATNFFRPKAFKALHSKSYTDQTSERIEIDSVRTEQWHNSLEGNCHD